MPLAPRTVAAFYTEIMQRLARLGIAVHIWPMPVEIPDPIRFEEDVTHHAYDPASANAFWRTLASMYPVFERFRGRFVGKCSPVHFFWGSFDLAVTRYSGERAPERPGADSITREAYSHAVISHGFWPGGEWPGAGTVESPVYYAYAVPEPAGFAEAVVRPPQAFRSRELGEFLLPYDSVRAASSPREVLLEFMESTYTAGAELGHWDRAALERHP